MKHSNILFLPFDRPRKKPSIESAPAKKKSITKCLLSAMLCVTFTVCLCACSLGAPKVNPEFKNRMESGHYDSIFLSSCGTAHYAASDFAEFRGTNTYLVPEDVSDEKTLCAYLSEAYQVNPELSVVFLQIDPQKLKLTNDPEKNQVNDSLLRLMAEHPDTVFQIMLPHPGLSYLTSIAEAKRDKAQEAGTRLVTSVSYSAKGSNLPGRVHIYYPGAEEWLISNPANYDTDFITVPQIAQKLLLLCFCDGAYEMTTTNVDDYYTALHSKCNNPVSYPDFSEETYVFIGDSIFGNDTGVLSIPGMINGLTNAKALNLGIGGATAAECATAPTSFSKMVDTCEQSISESYEQYAADDDKNDGSNQPITPTMFFINFGLNDYMQGVNVEAYKKALIDQTTRLMKAYPDARFVILSPSYCTFFQEGTERKSPEGSPLQAYRDAALEAAKELGISSFNSYELLGFNADNADLYLADGCHMTETGRFIMSQKLIEFMEN